MTTVQEKYDEIIKKNSAARIFLAYGKEVEDYILAKGFHKLEPKNIPHSEEPINGAKYIRSGRFGLRYYLIAINDPNPTQPFQEYVYIAKKWIITKGAKAPGEWGTTLFNGMVFDDHVEAVEYAKENYNGKFEVVSLDGELAYDSETAEW